MAEMFAMRWPRVLAGYALVERPPQEGKTILSSDPGGIFIVARGEATEEYDPFRIDGIYRRLAEVDTSDTALAFSNAFGLFSTSAYGRDEYRVDDILDHAAGLRAAIDAAERGNWQPIVDGINHKNIGRCTLTLHHTEGAPRPDLSLQPSSLIAAIQIQFALDCAVGAQLKKCLWCSNWFKYGPGTGHRQTAVYCSPKCQKAHAYAKTKAGGA